MNETFFQSQRAIPCTGVQLTVARARRSGTLTPDRLRMQLINWLRTGHSWPAVQGIASIVDLYD
jgi:hypothetical protein